MKRIMSEKERQTKFQNTWKALNARGIYTEEQLDEAIAKQAPLDLTLFFTPVPGLSEKKVKELEKIASKYKVVSKPKNKSDVHEETSTA